MKILLDATTGEFTIIYWFINLNSGETEQTLWCDCESDRFRASIQNVHETREAAEAYRNKLVEVMGKEGV